MKIVEVMGEGKMNVALRLLENGLGEERLGGNQGLEEGNQVWRNSDEMKAGFKAKKKVCS